MRARQSIIEGAAADKGEVVNFADFEPQGEEAYLIASPDHIRAREDVQ